ncbi:MAG: hypothetical protein JWQ23_1148 [Herminiimonas sp.]|nr:hypothetical protein [Herminiimonas sp.]
MLLLNKAAIDIRNVSPKQSFPSNPPSSPPQHTPCGTTSRVLTHQELRALSLPPIDNLGPAERGFIVVDDFLRDGKIPFRAQDMSFLLGWCLQHKQFNALSWLAINGGSLRLDNLNEKQLQNLAEWLKCLPPITTIDLRSTKISKPGATALASALQVHQTLTMLDLSNTGITDEGAKAIVSALKGHRMLTTLCLDWNSISPAGIEALRVLLQETGTRRPWVPTRPTTHAISWPIAVPVTSHRMWLGMSGAGAAAPLTDVLPGMAAMG